MIAASSPCASRFATLDFGVEERRFERVLALGAAAQVAVPGNGDPNAGSRSKNSTTLSGTAWLWMSVFMAPFSVVTPA